MLTVAAMHLGCRPHRFREERRYFLTDAISTMEVVSESGQPRSVPSVELGFDRRQSLFQHPPSVLRFPSVPSGPGVTARFATAMLPKAYDAGTDGVTFLMRCLDAEERWTDLYREELSPEERKADPSWRDHGVSLALCAAPETTLELETSCGPRGDCSADWALWGTPVVDYQTELELPPRRLVLLISIDTLRPERLGLYGAARPTSPELERLAEDGVVFEQAVASSPWTIPSHASLLTSTYPRVHGADRENAIRDALPSVATVFARAGWQTAAFVDTPYLNRKYGFDRGFEHFDDEPAPAGDFRRGAPVVLERVVDWLSQADDRPAFVFWHLMDVHGPYGAAAPFGGRFRSDVSSTKAAADERMAQLRSMKYHDYLQLDRYRSVDDLIASYDEGIAQVDAVLGRLFALLRDADLYDDALILVTSDHGESFLDHGVRVGHGLFLVDDEIRVPLVVKLAHNRRRGERVSRLVGLVDVAPSLLELSGVDPEPSFQGESLFATTDQGTRRSPLFGFSDHVGASYVRTDEIHFVGPATETSDSLRKSLFREGAALSLALEPLLETQVYAISSGRLVRIEPTAEVVERSNRWLARHLADVETRRAGATDVARPALDPEEIDKLRQLGYVEEGSVEGR